MKRKKLMIALALLLVVSAALAVYIVFLNPNHPGIDENTDRGEFELYLDNFRNLLHRDAIPPLESPEYISASDAHFLADDDKVFVLESDEGVFIYPQKIMVWHEVVNETIDGISISVTYCPLTGSAIGYKGDAGEWKDNTYGTSGSLFNSNLVLYDRKSESYIPQILGVGINSGLEGTALGTVPVHWADWKDARTAFPDARILSLKTGFDRDYFIDPYGSYKEGGENTYYQSGSPNYAVLNENDGTFPDKKIVVGVKYNDETAAIDPEAVRKAGVMSFNIGGSNAVAAYDESLKTVRVYLTAEDGTRSSDTITYFDVMWFAWYAYYPDTTVIN